MPITKDNLLIFNEILADKTIASPAISSLSGAEHQSAKLYLLNLLNRFPPQDDNSVLEQHIKHFLWVRSQEFKGVKSVVNRALNSLNLDNREEMYLNRQTRHDIEKSLIQKMLNQIFEENSLKLGDIPLQILDLDRMTDLYQMTEHPSSSITSLYTYLPLSNDIYFKDEKGVTLLHHAAKNGDSLLANQLIELGLSPNTENKDKETPFSLAVMNNKPDVVATFLAKTKFTFSDIMIDSSLLALTYTIRKNIKEVALVLFRDPNITAYSFDVDAIVEKKWLSTEQANEIMFKKINTPLMQAVLKNDKREVERLLDFGGADINEKQKNSSKTALHLAIEEKNEEIAILLINNGADINSVEHSSSNSILHDVVAANLLNVVELLLETGANVDVRNSSDITPLVYAIMYYDDNLLEIESARRFEIIAKLLAHPHTDLKTNHLVNGKSQAIDQIVRERQLDAVIDALGKARADRALSVQHLCRLSKQNILNEEKLSHKRPMNT